MGCVSGMILYESGSHFYFIAIKNIPMSAGVHCHHGTQVVLRELPGQDPADSQHHHHGGQM